jgi:histidinol dehydrogenase
MKIIENPTKDQWSNIALRPQLSQPDLEQLVSGIMQYVKQNGDAGIRHYTRLLDGVELPVLQASKEEISSGKEKVTEELKAAISLARKNIETFHRSQLLEPKEIETTSGVQCWQKQVPIERVGLYIPGGSAPLFSSILMLGIPASLAGCKEIILCTPPNNQGEIHPAILYTASILGIETIFKAGGAQAIAGFTFGTESMPKVDKIFGPGNQYVTKAKEMAQQFGVAIDMPAGPSEVLVIADETCQPAYVAADLLSQAEHGKDSQVILLTNSRTVLDRCVEEVKTQLQQLPRKQTAEQALKNSKAILMEDLNDCMSFSNVYAPEHLIIATGNAEELAGKVTHAGSVFLGNYSCESAGDYASGTNHTLPTNGYARSYSGVSVDSFCKKITFQRLSASGIQNIGPSVEIMAEAEGLWGHKNAVTVRLNDLR